MFERKKFIIWAAGFFDGEGCVIILPPHRHTSYILVAHLSQSKRVHLEPFREVWGGGIYRAVHMTWQWNVRSVGAYKFFKDVLPYLRVKKEQAELALEFQSGKDIPGRHLAPGRKEIEAGFYTRLKALHGNAEWREARLSPA